MAKITVNAMGQQCPIPVVQATRALEGMTEAGELTVLVDNVTATENLRRMAAGHQLTASVEKKGEGEFVVTIPVAKPLGKAAAPAAEPDLVAQIGSAVQEIADREVRTAAPKTPVRDAGVRFENLQFGKNVPGTR